ncbi:MULTISPECIES: hypothetical protein [Bradyrhizobium]|uniref:hypothetical protein n=1 Tax=Bradyrhizobium TaxID=374 RepID=UPI0011AE3270|nr:MULTISPECIES: hypothetical protein [Bradyrhizobium]MDE5457221.1 hypothetical protein [Bradyrhizobium sp. CSA112]WOH52906.1 hypothetical protein RX328_12940 [Bradyrhizobium sp. sBnM-33]
MEQRFQKDANIVSGLWRNRVASGKAEIGRQLEQIRQQVRAEGPAISGTQKLRKRKQSQLEI